MGQCTAHSKRTGERCKRFCAPGKKVCKWHGGLSTGPKTPMNTNALKTGLKQTIRRDTLFEDEKALIDTLSVDPRTVLEEQLRLLQIKERRISQRIRAAMLAEKQAGKEDATTGLKRSATQLLSTTTTRTRNPQGGNSFSVTSQSEVYALYCVRLEMAHNTVLEQISRVASRLAKIEAEASMNTNPLPLYTLPPKYEDA